MKLRISAQIVVVSLCAGFLAQVHAVSPAPDGCYPNFTTAEGCGALNSLTTGPGNTALGWRSLFSDSAGSFNTGLGAGALVLNDGDSNTAVGAAALLLNTNRDNTAIGTTAMVHNDTGSGNTAVGASALFNNATGIENSALGYHALFSHQGANFNNAVGGFALSSDETGSSNNAFGHSALANNVTGIRNTAIGDMALVSSTGSDNIALGANAGINQDTGSQNIYIGDSGSSGQERVIAIGANSPTGTPYTQTYIGGIYNAPVTDRIAYIQADGRLGTLMSSQRYKEDIQSMDAASDALYSLRPVTFHYKQKIDPSHKLSFGLVAEEVAEVSPDLVSPDAEGKPQTVRYDAINAMLLNEFLKEHRKVEELESRLARQEKQMESMAASLQRVSAQNETSRPTPEIAANRQLERKGTARTE